MKESIEKQRMLEIIDPLGQLQQSCIVINVSTICYLIIIL